MKLLNLGCGHKYHPDWINVNFTKSGEEVLVHDLRKKLPFEDNSFDAVYHSHVLEHFPQTQARSFLLECYRVLKPGGMMRVAVPDLEAIIQEYTTNLELAKKGDRVAKEKYHWILIELLDQIQRNYSGGMMLEYWKQPRMPQEEYVIERLGSEVKNALQALRSNANETSKQKSKPSFKTKMQDALLQWMGYTREMAEIGKFRLSGEVHYWMYDEFSLREILEEVGFQKVERKKANESSIPNFNTYLLDIEADGSVRKPDSLFMEGEK